MAAVVQFDLSTVRGFTRAVDWIRKNVLLKSEDQPQVVEAEVTLPLRKPSEAKTITLFMDRKNGYIFAFRGEDKTYVLKDDKADEYVRMLSKNGGGTVTLLPNVGSDHNSLGTFVPNKGRAGVRGRIYAMANLQDSSRLAHFSFQTGPVTTGDVAGAISTLVCMLAECARWPQMEHQFEKIYFGEKAQADEVFREWAKAKRIRDLAAIFPHYLLGDRVEKLVKRASDARDTIAQLRKPTNGNAAMTNKEFVGLCFRVPNAVSGVDKESMQRLTTIRAELKLDSDAKRAAEALIEIMDLCADEAAVRAARSGPIG